MALLFLVLAVFFAVLALTVILFRNGAQSERDMINNHIARFPKGARR